MCGQRGQPERDSERVIIWVTRPRKGFFSFHSFFFFSTSFILLPGTCTFPVLVSGKDVLCTRSKECSVWFGVVRPGMLLGERHARCGLKTNQRRERNRGGWWLVEERGATQLATTADSASKARSPNPPTTGL